ncbi:TRAP transporter permease [Ammoniphilus sp. YIM 78166]|uniref:TRAP transporter permease n=1 Tax=Ammoniphilus sp. YIM 78166 TaxID=1644106 RepID=UPI00106F540D|nr:TRAP transporter permease [Ammoniphilus sp. YIM 78166]
MAKTKEAEDYTQYSEVNDEGSTARSLTGFPRRMVTALAVAMSLYHIYVLGFFPVTPWILYTVHLGLATILILFLYPGGKQEKNASIKTLDYIFACLMLVSGIYIITQMEELIYRVGISPTGPDLIVGVILILLVLETTRRTSGKILPILAIIFLLYAKYGNYLPGGLGHRGYSWERLISYMTGMDAIFSVPLGASASFVFLFILFSAFLNASGAGKFFIDFSLGATGSARGGPAKTAVVASSLFGTVSGNSTANVVSTGAFTIPLMKKIGYSPRFSGAVESVASTGGQIMPPILGSAAFIMAQLIGVPYMEIVKASIIPALLYFATVFIMIDLEAARLGLKGLPKSSLPRPMEVLKRRGHLMIPLLVLIYVLAVMNASPIKAAIWAIAATLIVSAFRKESRMGWRAILQSLSKGAESALGMIAACATAGIIIGVLNLTGSGLKFASVVIALAGDSLPIALVLTMMASIILGMGLPTTAAYLITAAVVAPALVQMGVSPMAAHMFVLYFACLSAITPPVALAAFAGAGIARAKPMEVAFTSVKLGIVAFIVPFMFVYGPSLLWEGSLFKIILTASTALIGTYSLACAIQGWFFGGRANVILRLLLGLSSLMLIKPGSLTDYVGVGLLLLALALRVFLFKVKTGETPMMDHSHVEKATQGGV